jgi:hypothetical protein
VTALGHVLFNMLVNSVLSFVLALAIVYAVLRLFRFGPGRCRLWLLLLPFAKVAQDLAAGVPESSFLWAKLAGSTPDLGQFRLGVGWSQFGPFLRFELGAFSRGLIYPQSAGDILDTALAKHLGHVTPGALAAVVVAIGVARLSLHGWRSRDFLREVYRAGRVVDQTSVRGRAVEVFVSSHYAGVPFATGILRPRVVFSERAYQALNAAEREAALRHELAHVAHYDLVLIAGLTVVGQLFWFLPGARGLLGRIHGVLEQRADDAAVAAGAKALALASALVHAGEIVHGPVVGAAILSSRSLLALRVHRLIHARARSSKLGELVRFAIAMLVTITIAQALFLGNHVAALTRFATS